jgi:hypothetical protein
MSVLLLLSAVTEIRCVQQPLFHLYPAQRQQVLIDSLVLVTHLFQELAHNMGLMFVQLQ